MQQNSGLPEMIRRISSKEMDLEFGQDAFNPEAASPLSDNEEIPSGFWRTNNMIEDDL